MLGHAREKRRLLDEAPLGGRRLGVDDPRELRERGVVEKEDVAQISGAGLGVVDVQRLEPLVPLDDDEVGVPPVLHERRHVAEVTRGRSGRESVGGAAQAGAVGDHRHGAGERSAPFQDGDAVLRPVHLQDPDLRRDRPVDHQRGQRPALVGVACSEGHVDDGDGGILDEVGPWRLDVLGRRHEGVHCLSARLDKRARGAGSVRADVDDDLVVKAGEDLREQPKLGAPVVLAVGALILHLRHIHRAAG